MLFFPTCFLAMVFHHSKYKPENRVIPRVGYCNDINDQVVFQRTMKELWNFRLEMLLSVESSMKYSGGAWKIRMLKAKQKTEARFVKFPESFKESIRDICCF